MMSYELRLLLVIVFIILCVFIYFISKIVNRVNPILVSMLGVNITLIGGFFMLKYENELLDILLWFVLLLGLIIVSLPLAIKKREK